ncbi:MAG: glycoside hydrolase family 13 [Verrucomicrobia bacterium]|nr:MAG: glycoside hydrolase family 13 [Verrucomicrobiota bacterium]
MASGSNNWNVGLRRYSAKKMVKPINFYCFAPKAKEVYLIGDFNDWQPGAHPMERQPDGSWTLQVPLHHGHHHYQFLVDGEPTLDPKAHGIGRNTLNERVSIIAVS